VLAENDKKKNEKVIVRGGCNSDVVNYDCHRIQLTAIVGMGQFRFSACMIQLERSAQLYGVGGAVGGT